MRALVTGGTGFLGGAVVRQLLGHGAEVVAVSRRAAGDLEALGVEVLRTDLRNPTGLDEALTGVDVVFHTAAKTGVWGARADFMSTNVDGTQTIIDACRRAGVSRLVHTSSPSATFDGSDAEGAREADCPYPEHFEADYPESKAIAEKLVIATNSPELATTVLRPHLIWGPGDPHIIPRLISKRKAGRLTRVGDGKNRVGITYIENAAAAHIQAANVLAHNSKNAGKAYFVTDDEPVPLWPWIDQLLVSIGLDPIERNVSLATARRAGAVPEWVWRTFPLKGEPPMTRFVAAELASSHWYDLTGARDDWGYQTVIDPREAFAQTVAAFRQL